MRQKYTTENLFPIRCFNFNAPEELVADTLEKAKKLEFHRWNEPEGVGTTNDMHTNPEFVKTFEWFQHCIDTLHADNGWDADRIVVNKAWVNRSDASTGDHHDPHRHPMSYLSGIFYLTEGPPTVFLDPLSQREWGQVHLDGGPIKDSRLFVHPGAGGCFIFPSYMVHCSVANHDPIDRYTIAFNTLPNGNINAGGRAHQPMAKMTAHGWKEGLGPLQLSKYAG